MLLRVLVDTSGALMEVDFSSLSTVAIVCSDVWKLLREAPKI